MGRGTSFNETITAVDAGEHGHQLRRNWRNNGMHDVHGRS